MQQLLSDCLGIRGVYKGWRVDGIGAVGQESKLVIRVLVNSVVCSSAYSSSLLVIEFEFISD